MHISKLSLVNYRNFLNTKLLFSSGINTIIGENGTGKTNLFRAIRLLLDDSMIRSAYRLEESDFHRGLDKWQGHWIIISLEFDNISADEAIQALFLHGTASIDTTAVGKATYNLIFRPKKDVRLKLSQLASGDHSGLDALRNSIKINDYETVFTGRSDADFNNINFYKEVVGDFQNIVFPQDLDSPNLGAKIPSVLSISKEISFTFIQALRDVVSEFHNNRTNPLLTLLRSKSGVIDPSTFEPIATMVNELNDSIENLEDVQRVRTDIRDTIKDAAGEAYSPSSLSIKSDLSNKADRLFQSLKLFVGESDASHEGSIHELSLGGANLIFLTLKLLEFKYQKAKQSFANFLLIEEPEAHIHTHIQKTLFDKINYDKTQIIYSTHSVHISEVSNVKNMNILGRDSGRCDAYQPAAGLSTEQVRNIQRYLDAVRSNLLFAKSVILVEGDAEEILIPILIKKVLGVSLDELGISLINIRSTGFQNVAILFHDDRIRKKCSILTDLDTSIINTLPVPNDTSSEAKYKAKCKNSEEVGTARKVALEGFVNGNPWIKLFFAENTFEVDFITAGNGGKVASIVGDVYTDSTTIAIAKAELQSGNLQLYGRRVLKMAENQGKGWFAILLGNKLDYKTVIPKYIVEGIAFAHPEISKEVWFNILTYRLRNIQEEGAATGVNVEQYKADLDKFRIGNLAFDDIRNQTQTTFASDNINAILAAF